MEDLGLIMVLELGMEGLVVFDFELLTAAVNAADFGLLRIAGAMDCGGRRVVSLSGVVVTIAMGGPSLRVDVIVKSAFVLCKVLF